MKQSTPDGHAAEPTYPEAVPVTLNDNDPSLARTTEFTVADAEGAEAVSVTGTQSEVIALMWLGVSTRICTAVIFAICPDQVNWCTYGYELA